MPLMAGTGLRGEFPGPAQGKGGSSVRSIVALSALLGLSAFALPLASAQGEIRRIADLILISGRVITLDDPEPRPTPTAVTVAAGRILYVGDDAGALAYRGPASLVVDLAGGVVIPGFCDAHAHLYGLGKSLREIDLNGTLTPAEAAARVGDAALATPRGTWLQGRGWDQNDWPGRKFPQRDLLDRVTADRPALLRRVDGHAAWVNSAALRAAGITAETPDPDGGRVLRDERGEPTGILIDNAIDLVNGIVPPVDLPERRRRVLLAAEHCLAQGVTGVHDAGAKSEQLTLYRQLAADGELPLRVYAMLEDDPATLDTWLAAGPYQSRDRMFTARAVKLYADGALGSRGALLLADYEDEPGQAGLQITSTEHLRDVAVRAARAGFQVCTHAIGDGANRLVLDLYEEVMRELDLHDARWRIEHAQIVHPGDLGRFAALGVIASMQPVHCTSDMDWVEDRLGVDRCQGAYAWRTLGETGARLCFGTDFPVERVNPLEGLYAARTRRRRDGGPSGGWRPQECLDARTALRLYTAGGAYAAFQEEELGAVRAGMLADLTVLDGDPLAGPPEDLLRMRPILTIVAGKIRFDGR
jgi:predicted amidohydrolase YtcJ